MSIHYSTRQLTPPAGPDAPHYNSFGSNKYTSNQFPSSCSPSPGLSYAQMATPPRSPGRVAGPKLLPLVRTRDQAIEQVVERSHYRNASTSVTSTGFPIGFDPSDGQQNHFRRSLTPPEFTFTPTSATDTLVTPESADSIPFISYDNTNCQGHSRSTSRSASVDDAVLYRYGYPTYRTAPTCITTASPEAIVAPSTLPAIAPNTTARHDRHGSQTLQQSLVPELSLDSYTEEPPMTTLLSHLTARNPAPELVKRITQPSRVHDTHFWWDVRNVRLWHDFTYTNLTQIPHFHTLLSTPVPAPALPTSSRVNESPESLQDLHTAYSTHYLTTINAALRVALGHTPPSYSRGAEPKPGVAHQNDHPDFLLANPTSGDRTLSGHPRARVVGLLRSFNDWNTGMRAGSGPSAQLAFLRELALLQAHMRAHQCRYGFVITETELLCVRMGSASVPYFGYLELAPPINLSTQGNGCLTAGLALWWLGMMSGERALPGCCSWRVDVGGPTALTRQRIWTGEGEGDVVKDSSAKEGGPGRDKWMLKPEGREKRSAKGSRGWIWPGEPLSRKELGAGKGRRR